jgi:NSS family neurotransmitter:Na+ symporter
MGSVGYIIGPIFFLCLFSAGITSAISLVEPISASLTEKFDTSRKKTVTFIVLAGFLISLLYTTAYGSSILGIFDGFLNKFGLLLTMIMECVIFGWIYNLDNLLEAINRKSRLKLGTTWKLIIKYLIPLLVGILWIEGNIESFTSRNIISVVTQLILLAVLLTVPIIFTRLPAKVKNY